MWSHNRGRISSPRHIGVGTIPYAFDLAVAMAEALILRGAVPARMIIYGCFVPSSAAALGAGIAHLRRSVRTGRAGPFNGVIHDYRRAA